MNDQLVRLAEMTERENVVVQVVPANSKACAGFIGGFVIASFDGDDVGYIDFGRAPTEVTVWSSRSSNVRKRQANDRAVAEVLLDGCQRR